MKPRLFSRPASRTLPILLSAAMLPLLAASAPPSHEPLNPARKAAARAPKPFATLWHVGNFRYLQEAVATPVDLVTFVNNLPHPNQGNYGKVSSTRKGHFNTFLNALFAAIDASLADGDTGDWCGVRVRANDAGYEVRRFYDTGTGRWLIYGYDLTDFGQAYFFINPFAKRNIVIEVPHAGLETGTEMQGARLFRSLAARALIINKEHRCSDPEASTCGNATTKACTTDDSSAPVRESDVAHHTANTFYLLHTRFVDMDPVTKFVQLHGMRGSPTDMVEIGDGTTNHDYDPASVSVRFAVNLRHHVPAASAGAVHSCQEMIGDPPSNFCGEKNVEGRYANQPDASSCPAAATNPSKNRFLHVEQVLTLRDEDNGDGWYWGDISEALKETWPDCNMNNGATDCTLGSQQTQYGMWTCPA